MPSSRAVLALSLSVAAALALGLLAGATRPVPGAPVAQASGAGGAAWAVLADEPAVRDKLVHFLAGALFTLALAPAAGVLLSRWTRLALLLVVGLGLGLLVEVAQTQVAGRDASADDALAFFFGTATVVTLLGFRSAIRDDEPLDASP